MSVRSRAEHDYGGFDMKPMYNMDDKTLEYCEECYAWGYLFDTTGWLKIPVHVNNGKIKLEEKLTGEYIDSRTGERVKYMKYNIPAKATAGLKGYIENLKRKYEALYP